MAAAPASRRSWRGLSFIIALLSSAHIIPLLEAGRSPDAVESVLLDSLGPARLKQERLRARFGRFTSPIVRDGIPAGVQCNVTERCDSKNVCARVCGKGSVQVDPWLRFALDYQWRLARRQPLCFAQLLGTHNSAISLADGYGMHDDIYTSYLRYLRLAALTTNNQVLSLTDQLQLGVRFVELDVHWIQGGLHIAHCGGFHSARLNELVALLSSVARVFGHPEVEWDAETMGCDPSLSSLPTRDQRAFSDALSEVAAWLSTPQHAHEFLVLYLDNQADLQAWGKVEQLLDEVTQAIPSSLMITPPELRDIVQQQGGTLPSIDQLVAQYGKRVLLMSASDYGPDMDQLAFNHWAPCDFAEPLFRGFRSQPTCSFHNWRYNTDVPLMAGRMIRTPTCHLTYGPYNCSMQKGHNDFQLDAEKLPAATSCGVNVPSPDMLTPQLAESFIWSWAPGHPPLSRPGSQPDSAKPAETAAAGGKELARQEDQGPGQLVVAEEGEEEGGCALLRSSDGRWVVRPCGLAAYVACRLDAGPPHLSGPDAWRLAERAPPLLPSYSGDGFADCPPDYIRGSPQTARENDELRALVVQRAQEDQQKKQQLLVRQRQETQPLQQQQQAAAQQHVKLLRESVEGREQPRLGRGQRQLLRAEEVVAAGRIAGLGGEVGGHLDDRGRVGGGSDAVDGARLGEEGEEVAMEEEEAQEVYVLLALKGPSWLPEM